jgi:anthranilate 1,2-dioxygenase small subunit
VQEVELLALIDALQVRYARALDRRDLTAWLDCFASEASYTCTHRENVEQGLPLALMMDDCTERLRDRVKFITEVWAGIFEDYWTRHFFQRLEHRVQDDQLCTVTSNFSVFYTTNDGLSAVLAVGSYEDEVIIMPKGAKFRSRRAILDTSTLPRYLVYPV